LFFYVSLPLDVCVSTKMTVILRNFESVVTKETEKNRTVT